MQFLLYKGGLPFSDAISSLLYVYKLSSLQPALDTGR